jgi:L-alanine-DL-glutamate epimerase-like enolase superfamily enzyme
MEVVSIEVIPIEIPLRRPFAHHLNTHSVSRPQLVRLTLADGTVGWGEAQPREYVTGESIASVHEVVGALDALWRGTGMDGLEGAATLLRASPFRAEAPAAFAGVELALLDAVGRSEGRNVTEILGFPKTEWLPYDGAVIGFLPPSALGMVLMRVRQLGKRVVKLKAGRDGDRERIATVRRILGDDVRIVLDANGAWTAEEAIATIQSFQGLGVEGVEQPVARHDLAGMAAVRAAVEPQIIADESVCTMDDAQRLVDAHAADAFNIRIGKCGGLLTSLDLIDFARQHGILANLGVMVGETGIAGTAGRLLAACTTGLRDREFDSSGNAQVDVLCEPLAPIVDNRAPVPPLRPGLGYEIDTSLLRTLAA